MPIDKSKILDGVRAKAVKAFKRAGNDAEKRIKDSLSTPYPPASVPGEPPHERTGRLMKSVRNNVATNGKYEIDLKLIADAPEAVWMEYGTEHIAPRPFMRPDSNNTTKQIKDILS